MVNRLICLRPYLLFETLTKLLRLLAHLGGDAPLLFLPVIHAAGRSAGAIAVSTLCEEVCAYGLK